MMAAEPHALIMKSLMPPIPQYSDHAWQKKVAGCTVTFRNTWSVNLSNQPAACS